MIIAVHLQKAEQQLNKARDSHAFFTHTAETLPTICWWIGRQQGASVWERSLPGAVEQDRSTIRSAERAYQSSTAQIRSCIPTNFVTQTQRTVA